MKKELKVVFLKILKKDLKRKKAMNIILFLFMIIASMLIASSVNMLYTTTTALDNFKKVSNTVDNMILTYYDEENDKKMEEWATSSDKVKSISYDEMISVTADDITLPMQCKELSDNQNMFTLAKIPEKYNLVFNQNDEAFKLKAGEVAIPLLMKEKTGIKLGDKIKFKVYDCEKEFTVKHYVKEVTFGSELLGIKRIIISDIDYKDLYKTENKTTIKLWSIIKNQDATYEDVEKDYSKTSINSIYAFNSSLVTFSYFMDLMTAAIMIVLSIFLILISFLILRFTIIFTIKEDYKEIGIMKAIGLKNKGIKSIYMAKYFALALVGGGIGFIASIPFASYLMDSISTHIMMKATRLNYVLSVISVVFIIFITVGFCYMCTRKINKLSAIDAIRQGSTGERFSVSRKLKLHKMQHISTPIYLALSDLIGGFKKFIILMITFILGTAIIIIPINLINTMSSSEVITLFGLPKTTDFFIGASSFLEKYMSSSIGDLAKDLSKIEQKAKDEGVNIKIYPEINFYSKIYADNPDEGKNIRSLQSFDFSTDNYAYLSGTAPKLENEIAISTKVAEYFEIGLGDTINCSIQDNTDQFIVTATYQSMNNTGYSVRLSEMHEFNLKDSSGIQVFGEINDKDIDKEEVIKTLIDQFPELDIKSTSEYIGQNFGSSTEQLGMLKNIILVIVLGINFLITCLLVRMLITKEISEIAVLKSTGFKDKDIRKWQTARIAIILIISVMLGTLIANLTGDRLATIVFNMMGITQMKLLIEPLQVFVIYPIIILVVTMLAVLVSLGQVRKTNIWEINNQE